MFRASIWAAISRRNFMTLTGLPVTAPAAVRRKLSSVMPGISSGVWKDRNIPARARTSAVSWVMSCPRKMIWPRVTV